MTDKPSPPQPAVHATTVHAHVPDDADPLSYEETLEEEMELAMDEEEIGGFPPEGAIQAHHSKLDRDVYFRELFRLQHELVKLQSWVQQQKLKVVVLFEGRDSAGKGGVIKRITQRLNPRVCKVVALSAPTEREKSQWYFQRYVSHLPGAGEITLFDRSWYNRAGVERVMGFCNPEELAEFFNAVPEFERMLVRSGIILIKYWFSITDAEQEYRFGLRINDPLKQWKLSPMDVEARARWEDYTAAKEEMLAKTSIPQAPWWIVEADDKRKARLNCIAHFLSRIPYGDVSHAPVHLPGRVHHEGYQRHAIPDEMYVPRHY